MKKFMKHLQVVARNFLKMIDLPIQTWSLFNLGKMMIRNTKLNRRCLLTAFTRNFSTAVSNLAEVKRILV